MGAGAHTDFGSITLLYVRPSPYAENRFQDDVGGLQVQSQDSWIEATPIKDTILYLFPENNR